MERNSGNGVMPKRTSVSCLPRAGRWAGRWSRDSAGLERTRRLFVALWISNNLLYKTRDPGREDTGGKGEEMMGSIFGHARLGVTDSRWSTWPHSVGKIALEPEKGWRRREGSELPIEQVVEVPRIGKVCPVHASKRGYLPFSTAVPQQISSSVVLVKSLTLAAMLYVKVED